jgi:hypothetical protein
MDVKPGGKGLLGRSRCRWEANIQMYLKSLGCDGVDWINMVQGRDRCSNETSDSIKGGGFI